MSGPVIGITPDISDGRATVSPNYGDAVTRAGGVPVVLLPRVENVGSYLDLCDAFILTGGDDPIMEDFGFATHAKAKKVAPARQQFELVLLRALDHRPSVPALGVCLGMQMMALHRGFGLHQHLPESHPDLARVHWGKLPHPITGDLGLGALDAEVNSHHRQAIIEPERNSCSLRVAARAPDGVIEAMIDDARSFYLGVQWHPERTADETAGRALFDRLIDACRRHAESVAIT